MKPFKNALSIILLLWLAGGSISPAAAQSERPLRIGAILGLSGPAGLVHVAQEMQAGIEIAKSSGTKIPLQIVYEDDKGALQAEAVKAASKLIDVNKVDVIINWGYSTHPAVAPLCERAHVPCVVAWDSNKEADSLGGYSLAVGISTEAVADKLARFAFTKLGARRLAVIAAEDHWSLLITRAFTEVWKSLGGKVLLNEAIPVNTTDVRSLLTKAKAAQADLIFVPLYSDIMYTAVRQARELGIRSTLLSADSFIEYDIQVLGQSAEGVYAGQIWVTDPTFQTLYRARQHRSASPVGLSYAALAYDAVRFVDAAAAAIDGEITGPALAAAMRKTPFNGITGPIDLSSGRKKSESIVKVGDGKFELIEP